MAIVAAGCGGGGGVATPEVKDRLILQDIGELYRVCSVAKNKPPSSKADLKSFANVGPAGFGAIDSGAVVVQFGATMKDLQEGPASTPSGDVLAYEKQVPESGGNVLMLDRTVKKMTAEEFKSAPKAGK